MFAARPIVAAAVGGLPKMADGGALALVPPDDPPALAREIARLLDDKEAAGLLARRAGERADQWPDAEASAAAVLEVYASLLETA
jgi:glycosyltransferase involved in cell wall biosynthesis